MKKRFVHIIYTFFLAIALLMPMMPSVATATDADAKLFPEVDQRLIALIERSQQLQTNVLEGENSIGLDRIFFNLSVSTGIPVDDVHDHFDNHDIDSGEFVVCEMIAHISGKDLDSVIEDSHDTLTTSHLVRLYNLDEKLVAFRFDNLNNAITNEIAGIFPYDLTRFNVNMAHYADRLDRSIVGLSNRLISVTGDVNMPIGVENFLFKRVAAETGIQMNVLLDLRQNNATMPLGEFFARVMIADSLAAGNIFSLNINQDFNIDFSTMTNLTDLMRGRQVSPELLFSRVNLLRRELRNATAGDINAAN